MSLTRNLVKKLFPKTVFKVIEPYGHLIEAIFFNTINFFPLRGLKVIGVTGTNGKTTTSLLIHRMLQDAGYNCGLMTTISYGVGEDIKPQMHHMTTVAVPQLIARVKAMKKKHIDYLILETTSHALAQNRVWGVPYSIAVFTNLTHEHLAYHGTFEKYRQAKVKLFKLTNKNKKGLRTGIVNADDLSANYFSDEIAHPLSYGIQKGSIRADDIKLSKNGSDFKVHYANEEINIHCNIPGSFNVYNSLAAIAVGKALNLTAQQVQKGIAALQQVEGRMTRINEGQDFEVIVDYAHSPDSFEKLFIDLKPVVKNRLIILFGSLGGGDKGKRPLQGELAGAYGDIVVLCEEDDRLENPEQILNDIAKGVKKKGKILNKDLFLVHDRPKAIRYCINLAKAGDTILLLGKGHEKTIEHADGEHPWDEIKEAHQALQEYLKKG